MVCITNGWFHYISQVRDTRKSCNHRHFHNIGIVTLKDSEWLKTTLRTSKDSWRFHKLKLGATCSLRRSCTNHSRVWWRVVRQFAGISVKGFHKDWKSKIYCGFVWPYIWIKSIIGKIPWSVSWFFPDGLDEKGLLKTCSLYTNMVGI